MADETVLKVGTQTDPGRFAGAVFKSLERGGVVKARAFGAGATFVMIKGVVLAQKFFADHGKQLYTQTRNESKQLDDGFQIQSVTLTFFVTTDEESLRPGLN